MKLPSLAQVAQRAGDAVRRFPVVMAMAVTAVICAVVLVDREKAASPSILFPVALAAVLGIPFLFSFAVLAEKRAWGVAAAMGAQAAGVVALAAFTCTVPPAFLGAPIGYLIRFFLFAVALHLLAAYLPSVGRTDVDGFWQYNRTLFLRVLIAAVFALVLYAGLAIAMGALDNLFGMNVPGKRYFQLCLVDAGVFFTWFFLAGVPRDLDALDGLTEYPKAIKVFGQYILFPLVVVYLLILYVYLGKILVTGVWPHGWVSNLILWFSVTGIFTLLLLHPIRDAAESRWIGRFSRWFYVVLLPLLAMLFFAIGRRISDYGLTVDRYIVVTLGVWLTVLCVYFIASRAKSIKVIPLTACIVALLVSAGPWGALSVSERSQTARLKATLEHLGLLKNGTVRPASSEIAYASAREISSDIDYIREIHGCAGLQQWFPQSLHDDSVATNWKDSKLITEMLHVRYIHFYSNSFGEMYALSMDGNTPLDVTGYDRFISLSGYDGMPHTMKRIGDVEITLSPRNDSILLRPAGGTHAEARVALPVRALAEKLHAELGSADANDLPPEKLSLTAANDSLKVKVYFTQIRVTWKDGKAIMQYFNAEILYGPVKHD